MARAWLAFAAAVAAVVGAWEVLAAVERTRVAASRAVVAPLVRAGREGRAPTAPSAGGWRSLAAGALLAAGLAARRAVARRSRAASPDPRRDGARRARRRRRYRAALAAAAPAVARALADALSARALRPRRGRERGRVPGRGGPRARRGRARARARGADRGRARAPAPRAGAPAWDTLVAGILLQRDAGGDLPALLRELAAALEAAGAPDRDARAATAQARFTARLVSALPLGAALLAELA